jgi:GT2 family glycosyltransferase
VHDEYVETHARPGLTVVVPATDQPKTLARSLAAIRAASDPPEEIVVVDEPSGAGPAEARNRGALMAKGDVVVFVDSDVVVHPDAFERIRSRFTRDPALAGLFGAYDDRPEAAGIVSRFRNLLHHHVHVESAGPVASFWAGLGAVRRDVLEEIGGFDAERYPRPSIEDIELGYRLAARGYRIELDPSIRGTHLKEWTLASMIRTDLMYRGGPWIALTLERRSWPTTLNLGHRHRVSALASIALVAAVAARRRRAMLAALATLLVVNRSFYGLLARRLGALRLPLAIALHVLHQLVAVAAVPVGAAMRARQAAERRGTSR